jgi:hypothetical protein
MYNLDVYVRLLTKYLLFKLNDKGSLINMVLPLQELMFPLRFELKRVKSNRSCCSSDTVPCLLGLLLAICADV